MVHLPLILLGSGLAFLGYGLVSSKKGEAGATGVDLPSSRAADNASANNPPTPPQSDGLRRGIPPELTAAVNLLILNGTDPTAAQQMATTIDGLGYTELADALRMRAAELQAVPVTPVPAPAPSPLPSPAPSPGYDSGTLPTGNPLLRQGSSGTTVQSWQLFLLSQGFTNVGTPDGKFGPNTAAATVAFQQSAGLQADGVVGPNTIAAAKARLGV